MSPRQATTSTPSASITRKHASSASRLAWMSEMRAYFILSLRALSFPGLGGCGRLLSRPRLRDPLVDAAADRIQHSIDETPGFVAAVALRDLDRLVDRDGIRNP